MGDPLRQVEPAHAPSPPPDPGPSRPDPEPGGAGEHEAGPGGTPRRSSLTRRRATSPLQWFDSIDLNRDGLLDAKELQKALAMGNMRVR